jgi:hypothetical protein
MAKFCHKINLPTLISHPPALLFGRTSASLFLRHFFFLSARIVERFAAPVFTLFGQEGFVRGARQQAIGKQICNSLLFINILFFIDFS